MSTDLLRAARERADRLWQGWCRLDFISQFTIAASAILASGMVFVGAWVHRAIEERVVRSIADSVALYINSTLDPYLQELAYQPGLGQESQRALNALIASSAWRERVLAVKVWRADGTIVYSDRKELVGRNYPLSASLRRAWSGQVEAELASLEDEENEFERLLGVPLLEIYAPVRAKGAERIIAVVEFYQQASVLERGLAAVRRRSWYVLCIVTGTMLVMLFVAVRRTSRSAAAPQQPVDALREIHSRSVETNELFLKRVGMELHDGPAQLIGLALLRLDTLRPDPASVGAKASSREFDRIQNALRESLSEIRSISAGLALPELDGVSPVEALQFAARNHERRTGTKVRCDFEGLPGRLPTAIVSCLYRFAQEGLNNAFRHAGGIGQTIRGRFEQGVIEIEVSDRGPGFDPGRPANRFSLGLRGMRERVASLGGQLDIDSGPGTGTRLTVRFAVPAGEAGGSTEVIAYG